MARETIFRVKIYLQNKREILSAIHPVKLSIQNIYKEFKKKTSKGGRDDLVVKSRDLGSVPSIPVHKLSVLQFLGI